MQRKHVILNAVLACSVFLLGGCASTGGLITSLEDLTTESSKEGLRKIPQYRVISVPGTLPFAEPGTLHFYKSQRKPSSAIGLSHGDSYVMQSVIESECDEKCLSSIRDNLLLLRGKAEALVEDRINLTKVIANRPPEGSDASGINTYKQTVEAARSKYSKTRQELDSKHQDVLKSINKNGILTYRWNSSLNKNGSLGLGKIFGVSGSKNETHSGFALVSGLRTATLYVGRDLIKAWKQLDTESKYSNRFELTTHVMQAKYIIYITEYDLQSMVNAKLKASYAQLANLPETIKGLDQIEIDAALSKVANLSNMGVFGKLRRTTRKVDWTQPSGILKLEDLDGWLTFYSVESDLTDMIQMLSENKEK
jgi:hypothetical protein